MANLARAKHTGGAPHDPEHQPTTAEND